MQFDRLRRREVITLLGGAAAACPIVARAQRTTVPVIGFLRSVPLAGAAPLVDAFRQGLKEAGFAEGQNVLIEFRSAEGHLERLPQIAVDFVKTNPDVIVAGFGTSTAKAAQAATASIPIVFTSVGDPIGSGIVKSLNRPGGNITGLHAQAAEIAGKRLQILEELSPGIRIVAALLEPDAPFTSVALPELKSAADARGQRLEICEVRTADRLAFSVEAAAQAGATGLVMLETPLLLGLRRQIVDLAAKLRLSAVYNNREFVEAGGLLSYGADRRQLYRRAGRL